MTALKMINVKVENPMAISLYEKSSYTLYSGTSGVTSLQLTPTVMEEGEALLDSEIEFIDVEYDQDVVSYDENSKTITAVSKGKTQFIATAKSLKTGHIVKGKISIDVELVNEDKTSSITLPTVFADEGQYPLSMANVFADLSSQTIAGLDITYIADLSNGVKSQIPYNDGEVDVSKLADLGLTGQRNWYVECGKFAYTVSVLVEKTNYSTPLIGEYMVEEDAFLKDSFARYNVKLEYIDREYVVSFISANGDVIATGNYTLRPWTQSDVGGEMVIKVTKGDIGVNEVKGYYFEGNGLIRLELFINGAKTKSNQSVSYCLASSAPYAGISGSYSANYWKNVFVLNEDKTVSVMNNGEVKTSGTYTLTPTSLLEGSIEITLQTALAGQTQYVGTYSRATGEYSLKITVAGNQITHNKQGASSSISFVKFAGHYSVYAIVDETKNLWLGMKFFNDGSMVLSANSWDGANTRTNGSYELIADKDNAQQGTIKITLVRGYSGNKEFTGQYIFEDGKYKINIKIQGSGGDDGLVSATQVIS